MRYQISEYKDYCNFLNHNFSAMRSIDSIVEGSQPTHKGFCSPCKKNVDFLISDISKFNNSINLRESVSCECGLNQRARLILDSALNMLQKGKRVAIFEASTYLSSRLSGYFSLTESSYFGADISPGSMCILNDREVAHQDMTNMSYEDNSFDALIHNDILEHIPNYKLALEECRRVLKPEGLMIFTAPFFGLNEKNLVRARIEGGKIIHLLPEELHGDPLNPLGILAYYNFGFELVEDLKGIFKDVYVEINIDLVNGYTSNNHSDPSWNMPSIVIISKK